MKNCHQTPTQTIWEHGLSVADYYTDIRDHLEHGSPLKFQWRLPEWINHPRIMQQLDRATMREYHVYHDCGKPFCRTLDDQGRQHFHDHARISANIWRSIGGHEQTVRLIEMDMLIHTMKCDEIESFKFRHEAMSLLLTGLAEIHSNAAMFGGIESTSFKIKWKHLDKIGKRILK